MKRHEKVEKVQMQFLKKILGLERSTPNYIVLQECHRMFVEWSAARKVIKFERNVVVREAWGACYRECMKNGVGVKMDE